MSQEIKAFTERPLFDESIILNKNFSYPKISIVTPSYNQGQFLERTILSVLNQNYPNLEYIIIDGGSEDESAEIIKKYKKYLSYWVREPDKGQADAIRKGFEKSTGDILAYLNSDDTYLPESLVKVAKVFRKNSNADLVFGNINFIDKADCLIGELRFTKFDFLDLIYEGGNLHQTGSFWSRKIYKKAGGINPDYRFCMDYDFFCRAAKKGTVIFTRDYLANFRFHEKAKSSTIFEIGDVEHQKIKERYLIANKSKFYLKYKTRFCQIRRFFKYICQGDADYALRGLYKRIFNRL